MSVFNNELDALDTITTVFEAMAAPDLWPVALDKLAFLCEAKYSVLYFHDDVHEHSMNSLMNHVSERFPLHHLMPYLQKYGHHDLEAISTAFELDRSREEYLPFQDIEAFRFEEGLDHPLFTEGRDMADFFRRAGIVIGRKQPWDSILLLQFAGHLESYPQAAFPKFQSIAPYVERAVNAGRYLLKLKQRFNQTIQILDRLKVAVCVVNGQRDIVIKNRSFDQLIEEQSGFRVSMDQKLKVMHGDQNKAVEDALEDACRVGAQIAPGNGASLIMYRDADRSSISVEISPMVSVEDEKSKSGFAIIFAVDPDWMLVKKTENLSKAFDLSTSENQIVPYILEGLTNREIADIRGVSNETIKSHISSILRKTNSMSRTELAMLAASTEIPIYD